MRQHEMLAPVPSDLIDQTLTRLRRQESLEIDPELLHPLIYLPMAAVERALLHLSTAARTCGGDPEVLRVVVRTVVEHAHDPAA